MNKQDTLRKLYETKIKLSKMRQDKEVKRLIKKVGGMIRFATNHAEAEGLYPAMLKEIEQNIIGLEKIKRG